MTAADELKAGRTLVRLRVLSHNIWGMEVEVVGPPELAGLNGVVDVIYSGDFKDTRYPPIGAICEAVYQVVTPSGQHRFSLRTIDLARARSATDQPD